MANAPSADGLFDHDRRLERAFAAARFVGAPIILVAGFTLPTLGVGLVVALVALALGYSVALVRFTRPDRPPERRRIVVAIGQLLDTAAIAGIIVLFSPDDLWTARLMAPLLIFGGGFRFGLPGAVISALAMSVTLVGTAAYREAVLGFRSSSPPMGLELGLLVVACVLVVATVRELTNLRDRQAGLFEPLLRAQEALGIGLIVSHGPRVEFVNQALERMAGRSPARITPNDDALLDLLAPEERAGAKTRFEAARRRPIDMVSAIARPDGTRVPTALARMDIGHNGIRRAVTLFRDLTVERRSREQLRALADADPLTGLPNRNRLRALVGDEIAARPDQAFAILAVDLRRFGAINETFGQETGDALLREVAPRIAADLRAQDVLARVGSDDFGILMPGGREASALALGRQLRASFERAFAVGDQQLEVGLDVGIAIYPDDGTDAPTLLRRADVALAVAHRSSADVERYRAAHDSDSRDRLQLASQLRSAIGTGELVLEYQPARDLRTGRAIEAEALVRWNHPTRGMLLPGTFIGLAEQTGLIKPLTDRVLMQAIRDRGAMSTGGHDIAIAVNLSMRNLTDPQLPDFVEELLLATDVSADRLILEITESVLMGEPDRVVGVLRRLHALGVRVAIDDFGAGYSSLAYIHRLPVDRIKIDRSFVGAMARDERTAAIVQATIDLAHRLDLEVVAEGVEDGKTLAELRRLGCDIVQGYFVARPMPAATLDRWLREDRRP